MVTTVKFSEFDDINTAGTNLLVGLSDGLNAKSSFPLSWTTAFRPINPTNGTLGYNLDISLYEFWDESVAIWRQLGSGGSGSVTQIDTGTGLIGGPIVTSGTISFAPIQANSFLANPTGFPALPVPTSLAAFLLSANNLSDLTNDATARINLGVEIGSDVQAWSAILNQISAGVWPGATSITTLGTISTGVWQGSINTVPFGGTSVNSFTAYSVICGGITPSGSLQSVANVGTTGQVLTSNGAAALPTWQTNASGSGTVNAGLINQLAWYTASGTTVSGLTIVNSAGLLTNSSGVPGWIAYTGTGAPVLATSPTLVTPTLGAALATSIKLPTLAGGILDANGNPVLQFQTIASAVNFFAMNNNATGSFPTLSSIGADTNISMSFTSKGTGSIMLNGNSNGQALAVFTGGTSLVNFPTFNASITANPISISATGTDTNILLQLNGKGNLGIGIQGTSTNNNATAGNTGQFISSQIVQGSSVSLTTATPTNITSISLPAGDWQTWANVALDAGGANLSEVRGWISSTSATLPDASLQSGQNPVGPVNFWRNCVPSQRFSLSTTTTIFLSCQATFATGAAFGYGFIEARRMR